MKNTSQEKSADEETAHLVDQQGDHIGRAGLVEGGQQRPAGAAQLPPLGGEGGHTGHVEDGEGQKGEGRQGGEDGPPKSGPAGRRSGPR